MAATATPRQGMCQTPQQTAEVNAFDCNFWYIASVGYCDNGYCDKLLIFCGSFRIHSDIVTIGY